MSAAALIAKFSDTEASAVSGIANDVAAAVASEGIAALETNSVMADLEVRSSGGTPLCEPGNSVVNESYVMQHS